MILGIAAMTLGAVSSGNAAGLSKTASSVTSVKVITTRAYLKNNLATFSSAVDTFGRGDCCDSDGRITAGGSSLISFMGDYVDKAVTAGILTAAQADSFKSALSNCTITAGESSLISWTVETIKTAVSKY